METSQVQMIVRLPNLERGPVKTLGWRDQLFTPSHLITGTRYQHFHFTRAFNWICEFVDRSWSGSGVGEEGQFGFADQARRGITGRAKEE